MRATNDNTTPTRKFIVETNYFIITNKIVVQTEIRNNMSGEHGQGNVGNTQANWDALGRNPVINFGIIMGNCSNTYVGATAAGTGNVSKVPDFHPDMGAIGTISQQVGLNFGNRNMTRQNKPFDEGLIAGNISNYNFQATNVRPSDVHSRVSHRGYQGTTGVNSNVARYITQQQQQQLQWQLQQYQQLQQQLHPHYPQS